MAWTLEVEVQFYLLAPLLARVFTIRSRVQRRGLLVAVFVLAAGLQNAFLGDGAGRAELSLLNFIQYFLLGFLFADVYLTDWSESPRSDNRSWDAVALLGWPALLFLDLNAGAGRWLLPPLLFMLFCATFRGPMTRGVFRLHLLTTLGGMCYTIYLLHYPVMSLFSRLTQRFSVEPYGLDLLVQSVVLLPPLLILSAVFFLAVERPCMDPGWWRKLRRPIDASGPNGGEGVHRTGGSAHRDGPQARANSRSGGQQLPGGTDSLQPPGG